MEVLASCLLIATSLTLAMATHQLIGEPPLLMTPQHPNVYVYENNSMGERQNLVLPCSLMDTSNVMYQWFRGEGNQEFMVPAEMIDQVGTLTVYNITEGDYASRDGVKYYCVASRKIGKGNYTASVRSRTITVFYAFFDGFSRMVEEEVSVSVAMDSDVALECDVLPSSPPPQIRWLRDGNPIAEVTVNNEVRFLDGGRYLYLRSLTVANLASTYRCEVTNVFLDRTVMAPTMYRLIDNLTRGDLMDYKQIGDLTAFVGNMSFEFAYVGGLYSNGAINGTINILRNGTEEIPGIGNVGSIMTIDTVGMFELSATVVFDGVTRRRTGTLTVHQLPSITRNPTSDRELVVGMENLKYTCEFQGSLMPDIEWYFNGQPIAADSGISINGNNLTIASPQVSNSGIYQCVVSNDFGDDQAAWLLEIRPSILTKVMPYNFTELGAFDDRDLGALIVEENATTVNFFVDIIADPCPDITWFFNGTQLGPSNDTFIYNNACAVMDARSPNWRFTLTVPLLTEDTSGSYTATFTNIAGTTELPPAYFTIPAPVSVTGLTLSLPCLKEGQDLTLRCNITGFPRPDIEFRFNDLSITPGMGDFANFIEQTLYDEITIRNVNMTAQGRYACAIVNDGNNVMSRDYDFCTVPNITSATATPNPVLGEPFSIECTAAGTPQPQISWRKDGLPLEGTSDQVLRIVETNSGRTSSVEVSAGRQAFNGVYECIAINAAGSMMKSFRVELQESNQIPLSLGAIIGIAAGGVGLILLIAFVILLLVCVYALGRKTSGTSKYSPNPAHMGDFTDGRGNVDKDSDEEDGQPEAFNPQYESLPALRPSQPPSYKPTPSYPMGVDDMEMRKVPLPDSDSYLGGGGYMMQDNGMAYNRPGVDDFLSEDAQFV